MSRLVERDRSLTYAILGAGLFIGAGLYFGLSSKGSSDAGQSAPQQPAPTVATSAPTAVDPPRDPAPKPEPMPPPEPASSGSGANAQKAAEAALASLKKNVLIDRCWKPAIKANPEPAKSKHTLDITFGADGKQIARGFSDIRGESREDVSRCLSGVADTLQIVPAPGQTVRAELSLEFP